MATLDTYRFRPQGRAPAPLRPGGTPNSRRDTRPAPASRVAAAPRKRTLAAERATSRACAPRRVGVVCAAIGLAYLLLIGKLAYVQVGQHKHYVAEALRMRRKTIALSAPRGVMLDRNGTLLVQNEPAATIVVDPNLWGADLKRSWMVGDRASDIECGRSAGCATVLLRSPATAYDRTPPSADYAVDSMAEAVGAILGEGGPVREEGESTS